MRAETLIIFFLAMVTCVTGAQGQKNTGFQTKLKTVSSAVKNIRVQADSVKSGVRLDSISTVPGILGYLPNLDTIQPPQNIVANYRAAHHMNLLLRTVADSITSPETNSFEINPASHTKPTLDSLTGKHVQLIYWNMLRDSLTGVHSTDSSLNRLNELRETDHIGIRIPDSIQATGPPVMSKIPETGLSFTGGDLEVPDIPQLELNPNISSQASLPNLPKIPVPGTEIRLPENSVPRLSIDNLDKLGQVISPEVGSRVENFSEHKKVLDGVPALNVDVTDQVKNMTSQESLESVAGKLEDRLENSGALPEIMNPVSDLPKANFSDPQVARELLLNSKKEFAVNHFAGHEEKLFAAMDKLAEVKAGLKSPEGVVDVYKGEEITLKTSSLIERLSPGVNFQVQKPNSLWLDVNPYINARIMTRLAVQFGWNHRLAYRPGKSWVARERAYGPRMSVVYLWTEYLAPVASVEYTNTPIRRSLNDPGYHQREWVWTAMAGIRTSVRLFNNVRLTSEILYNLISANGKSPYINNVNARMGLEFRLRKKTVPHGTQAGITTMTK